MTWTFRTDPEFDDSLAWMRDFVVTEVEPLEVVWPHLHHTPPPDWLRPVIAPLKEEVRRRGLWACHLGPELGGQGMGQARLAAMNEILGRTPWASVIFGAHAPDTGNAEVLAKFGTTEQKERYLQPLLAGDIFSAFAMTEPHGGADATGLRCRATQDGDDWVLDGEKFYISNAANAAFLLVLAVTDPDAPPHSRMSLFLVPSETPGVRMVRDIRTIGEAPGEGMGHAHLAFDSVRLGPDSLLGERGRGFAMAQVRLAGGRIHHAMRAVGVCQRAYEMLLERVVSRETRGLPLASHQMVQEAVADTYLTLSQFRMFVRHTAWRLDEEGEHACRADVSLTKVLAARTLRQVVSSVIHLHGALGVSTDLPLSEMWMDVPIMGLQDGPSEVHLVAAARQLTKAVEAAPTAWPTEWIPARREAAEKKYAAALAAQAASEATAR
jgi:acyl-CoA dehydrogenase